MDAWVFYEPVVVLTVEYKTKNRGMRDRERCKLDVMEIKDLFIVYIVT